MDACNIESVYNDKKVVYVSLVIKKFYSCLIILEIAATKGIMWGHSKSNICYCYNHHSTEGALGENCGFGKRHKFFDFHNNCVQGLEKAGNVDMIFACF